jgi:hypothetical protein
MQKRGRCTCIFEKKRKVMEASERRFRLFDGALARGAALWGLLEFHFFSKKLSFDLTLSY